MDIKKRVLELLELLERHYNMTIDYFDDNERNKYLPKINEHLLFIKQTRDKVHEINPSSVKEMEKLVTIHAQILNKYYS